MKASITTGMKLAAASAMLVMLAACATQSGPTYTLRAVKSADQSEAYEVSCTGLLEDAGTCMDVAKKTCKDQSVTVLQQIDGYRDGKPANDPRKLTFVCG